MSRLVSYSCSEIRDWSGVRLVERFIVEGWWGYCEVGGLLERGYYCFVGMLLIRKLKCFISFAVISDFTVARFFVI